MTSYIETHPIPVSAGGAIWRKEGFLNYLIKPRVGLAICKLTTSVEERHYSADRMERLEMGGWQIPGTVRSEGSFLRRFIPKGAGHGARMGNV